MLMTEIVEMKLLLESTPFLAFSKPVAKFPFFQETIADTCDSVVMLFADLVGFTTLASELNETEVIGVLQRLFKHFDKLTDKFNVQKVKGWFRLSLLHNQ